MTSKLVTFRPDQTALEAMRSLLKHRISGGPVVEKQRRLVGMFSEIDCLNALASGAYDAEPLQRNRPVGELMTRNCVVIDPTVEVYGMIQLFETHSIRRLPVVEKGVLIGQVSRRDILRELERLC